jgi:MATE family multidrug resistance protein
MMNKELIRLAIPNIVTNLTVPMVSMVDLALMGRMPSSAYILAMGFGTVIFNFIYWAFGFLRMGTTGMVSQAYGKNDKTTIQALLFKGLTVSLIAGIVLILLQFPIKVLALQIIAPDASVVEPLSIYFNYRIYAAPATISLFVLSGWLLGMQDAKSAMILAILVNGVNATLSFVFVKHLNLDIQGVALGTVMAQYFGLFIGFLILFFKYKLKSSIEVLQFFKQKNNWKEFLSVNSDIFIRTLCLIFTMSFFKTKAGNIDPIVGAANILLLEFITISAYGIDGFAFAAEALSGKYFGLGKADKFRKAIKVAFAWGLGIAAVLSLVYLFAGEQMLYLLTDKSKIVEVALIYLPWLIAAPLINSFAFIWDGVYVGTTASKAMRNSMIIATVLIFLPAFYLGKDFFGNHGIWLAFSLFMLGRGVLLTILAKKDIYSRI